MGYGVALRTRSYRHMSAEERETLSLGLAISAYLRPFTYYGAHPYPVPASAGPGLPARATRSLRRPSLDARSEEQSGYPAEERIRKNVRTERSVNAPGGLLSSEK
jgi:hypothetical protein